MQTNSSERLVVFVVIEYFLPGFKAGGPMRTIMNMVDWMGDLCDFYIFTRDRDSGDSVPYSGITQNEWRTFGRGMVYYACEKRYGAAAALEEAVRCNADVIYLNSFFLPITFSVLFRRRLARVFRKDNFRIVLAPRGEFSRGALEHKQFKKWVFIKIAFGLLKLYDGIIWHVSTRFEAEEAKAVLGDIESNAIINFPEKRKATLVDERFSKEKMKGFCRFVFCSRITPKKNLRFLLRALSEVQGELELDVIGGTSDLNEWERCEKLIQELPDRIKVSCWGAIPHDRVWERLSQAHFFVLPTLGENYGHAIVEAFRAGCPPIISDRTPWRNLKEGKAGWDLPLVEGVWVEVLQHCVSMRESEYADYRAGAVRKGRQISMEPPIDEMLSLLGADAPQGDSRGPGCNAW